ncbi:hypothetical protein LA76x_0469 [Lysobacter antibioticus]|uniref:Uncharacterized protein n=1 Tax=Lysobacter antibioticus TaxID=84531 RepID=A0A0S2F533_LYSAN|nr:hypothetical protein LA76x_0469 [Lysobacter antibioticus]
MFPGSIEIDCRVHVNLPGYNRTDRVYRNVWTARFRNEGSSAEIKQSLRETGIRHSGINNDLQRRLRGQGCLQ